MIKNMTFCYYFLCVQFKQKTISHEMRMYEKEFQSINVKFVTSLVNLLRIRCELIIVLKNTVTSGITAPSLVRQNPIYNIQS